MMISTKGRYALRVMIDLAEHPSEGFIPLKAIAERQGISVKYLESIMALLSKGGLIEGKVLSVDELKSFGDLPSKDALIAQVLGTFLAPISSLAVVLDQIRQQKEGPAPAEEAAEAAAE